MKTFDVFVKDRLTQINVKPVRTFDVFIKDRLTQIDIVISTLVSREVFSFYDKMIIGCALRELDFLKEIEILSGMEIDLELERLHAMVSALAKTSLVLNNSLDLSQSDSVSGAIKIEISPLSFGIVNDLQTKFQSSKNITFNLDNFDTGLSLGKYISNLTLLTSQADTDKASYIRSESNMTLLNKIDFSGKKVATLNPINVELNVSRFGVFYLTLIEGNISIYLGTAPISNIVHNKILYSSGFETNITLDVLDSLISELYISGHSDTDIYSSIILILDKILYPTSSYMQLSCKASVGLYRRRLLEEIDNINLSDLDSNTLHELDYVLLD